MALIPYLFDEFRPRRLQNQLFGLSLSPEDMLLSEIIERPRVSARYLRPWRNLAAVARDVGSTIKCDKDKFQVNLDVQHFEPEEISVKTADGYVVVEGQHEEKKDEHGYVMRHFKRRYALPEGCNPESVESRLSSDGVLTVTAPMASKQSDERAVPITHTGPIRRKPCDEQPDQLNGDQQHEEKPPEKKRRK
ncbi:protein lethal(2)essential for life-like [Anticarsia gemmatalis]|uniref:protein lethal(2)essential for life-like n=1 Tax=Anticarsia gemmatalis TaxID=129554 RepID=UPI003F7670A3